MILYTMYIESIFNVYSKSGFGTAMTISWMVENSFCVTQEKDQKWYVRNG